MTSPTRKAKGRTAKNKRTGKGEEPSPKRRVSFASMVRVHAISPDRMHHATTAGYGVRRVSTTAFPYGQAPPRQPPRVPRLSLPDALGLLRLLDIPQDDPVAFPLVAALFGRPFHRGTVVTPATDKVLDAIELYLDEELDPAAKGAHMAEVLLAGGGAKGKESKGIKATGATGSNRNKAKAAQTAKASPRRRVA